MKAMVRKVYSPDKIKHARKYPAAQMSVHRSELVFLTDERSGMKNEYSGIQS